MKKANQRPGLQVNELSESTKVSLRTRIISAIVAIILVLPCIVIGDWLFFALILAFVVIGTFELIKCAKPKHPIFLFILATIFIVSITCLPLLRNIYTSVANNSEFGWELWNSFIGPYLSVSLTSLSFLSLFWFVVADANFTVRDACFIFTIGIALAVGLQSMLFLRYAPIFEAYQLVENPLTDSSYFSPFKNASSSALAFYIGIGTFMTDTGAYLIGILFGKNKINPRISPKKTWEGFFGGIIISTITSFAFAMIMALTGNPILQCLDLNNWYLVLIISLVMPFFATLGDFTFSALKRHYEIKDFGNVLPGHGGVLDRIDSLIFTASISAIIISIILSFVYPGNYVAIGGNPFL